MEQSPPVVKLLKNFPALHGTLRFITVITTAFHCPLSTWFKSMPPYPISPRSILMLSTTYDVILLMVSHLLALPPISYMHSSSSPFVQHALPISSSLS
jgi:hypothetical protein